MKTLRMITKYNWFASILMVSLIFMSTPCVGDDTCVFSTTANDVKPNIIIMLDNGAEMEQIVWHDDYDNSAPYTPGVVAEDQVDAVNPDGAAGNGFFHDNGYGIDSHGGKYYLVRIKDDMETELYTDPRLEQDSDIAPDSRGVVKATFTANAKSITLTVVAGTGYDDGVKDNASGVRYSKNYLNWLFFSGNYAGDGTDLPDRTRFYYAKKALDSVMKSTANKAKFGLYYFAGDEGASKKQPPKLTCNEPLVDPPSNNTLTSEWVSSGFNGIATNTYSPLAEGLAYCGGQYNSQSLGVIGEYCQKQFIILVTPGVPSMDKNGNSTGYFPQSIDFADHDGDSGGIGEGYIKEDANDPVAIPVNHEGDTYLDDIAHYFYTHDVVGYVDGTQNVMTYTVGFMGDATSELFLINTSNNGNGLVNCYDTTHTDYGKYHFTAESPSGVSDALMDAVNNILSRTNSFTAPVVPVTRTMSGNRIYLAFFLPNEGNLWAGNITKYGLSEFGKVLDKHGNAATYDNGAMIEGAESYWATEDWNDISQVYLARNIYTYLGASKDLTDSSNDFNTGNDALTTAADAAAVFGNPTHTTTEIINYIRGKDVLDGDNDGVFDENRMIDTNNMIICGDALHSEPLVVRYNDATTMIYFGGNDGMLHAVDDDDGSEAWAFIPSDQLHRLKDIVEGTGHQYFIDSSPKAYIVESDDDDDIDIEPGEGDKVYIICGERKGGNSYFALDVSDPDNPKFLWRVSGGDPAEAAGIPAPINVIPELGETWSPPVFGRVKHGISDETDVFFIGGGHKSDNTKGNTVLAIDVLTGALIRQFKVAECPEMTHCFPSPVTVVDRNGDGLVDKVYVGDRGGQLWRFGEFTGYDFPNGDANIDNWSGVVLFQTECGESDCANGADDNSNTLIDERRPFFYRPSVCLEHGYDLVFAGTGDREYPCNEDTYDGFYCVKDTHATPPSLLAEDDLVYVDNSLVAPATPDTPDLSTDAGWYVNLAQGEKILADNLVFRKVAYFTTFTPNDDPCTPGGDATLYGLNYLTGHTAKEYGVIGGGIPSKPVLIITEKVTKILVSVGSTNAEAGSGGTGSGTRDEDTADDGKNFFYLWWQEVFN